MRELSDILAALTATDDISWGMYAFSRDVLRDRISVADKRMMIQNAVQCGKQTAADTVRRMGTDNVQELARRMALKVEYAESFNVGGRILFALYTPPDSIRILREPIRKAAQSALQAGEENLTEDAITDLILGHEIFHFLEENDDTIYTRTERVTLWKLFGYRHQSTVRALSEIAAMSFTQKLNRFSYSPFALDILLFYGYDPQEAEKIAAEIDKIRSAQNAPN